MVKGDSNPLRPEVITLALIELLQSLPVSSQTRACWLLDGAGIMGQELQALYVLLNDFLAGQGIEPAAYGVVGAPQGRIARASADRKGGQIPGVPEFAGTGLYRDTASLGLKMNRRPPVASHCSRLTICTIC